MACASGRSSGRRIVARSDERERRAHRLDRHAGEVGPRQPVDGQLQRVGDVLRRGLPVDDLPELAGWRVRTCGEDRVDTSPDEPTRDRQRERHLETGGCSLRVLQPLERLLEAASSSGRADRLVRGTGQLVISDQGLHAQPGLDPRVERRPQFGVLVATTGHRTQQPLGEGDRILGELHRGGGRQHAGQRRDDEIVGRTVGAREQREDRGVPLGDLPRDRIRGGWGAAGRVGRRAPASAPEVAAWAPVPGAAAPDAAQGSPTWPDSISAMTARAAPTTPASAGPSGAGHGTSIACSSIGLVRSRAAPPAPPPASEFAASTPEPPAPAGATSSTAGDPAGDASSAAGSSAHGSSTSPVAWSRSASRYSEGPRAVFWVGPHQCPVAIRTCLARVTPT